MESTADFKSGSEASNNLKKQDLLLDKFQAKRSFFLPQKKECKINLPNYSQFYLIKVCVANFVIY